MKLLTHRLNKLVSKRLVQGTGGGGVEERKESGGEKAKGESRDCCVNFKPENYLEILLSVHARTSELIF